MSARRTRGGDLKDSKEEGGEEAVAMAVAGAKPESEMVMMTGHAMASDDADLELNAESSRDSKKRRVSTSDHETSIEFLDSAKSSSEVSGEADATSMIGTGGKVGGGTMQCGAAAGQASMDESTAHSEVRVDVVHASADRAGALGSGSGEGIDDVAVAETVVVVVVASYKSVISSMARANESNIFTAENYYLLHWLYRIRDVSCLRGLRISFLQPDFLWSMYRPMMQSKKWRTNRDIKVAVNLWCTNRAAAEERYGHISDWDVSSVTDMRELLEGKVNFNDDISLWNVSKVTNMRGMFSNARSFNQPVEKWDLSIVTNTKFMFAGAHLFNKSIGNWNVSNVTDMDFMFLRAHLFNQPIGNWDVSKVTSMSCMFRGASAFNQSVGDWDVSNVTDADEMFCDAVGFDQDLTRWDMRSARGGGWMFHGAHAMQRDNKPVAVRDDEYDEEGHWEEAEEEAGV